MSNLILIYIFNYTKEMVAQVSQKNNKQKVKFGKKEKSLIANFSPALQANDTQTIIAVIV